MSTETFACVWNEDGSAVLLGRVTSDEGTGSESPVEREGNLVKQADLSSVTYAVYDLSTSPVTTVTSATTLTISSVIYDTLQESGVWLSIEGGEGGNFKATLAPANFPNGNHKYYVECKFTMTSGAVGWGRWEGVAKPVRQS